VLKHNGKITDQTRRVLITSFKKMFPHSETLTHPHTHTHTHTHIHMHILTIDIVVVAVVKIFATFTHKKS